MILKLIKSKWIRTMQYIFQQSQTVLYALCNKENEVCPLLFMIIVICQIIHLKFNNQPCMNQYSSRVRHWISDLRIRGLCILLVNQTFLRRAGKVQEDLGLQMCDRLLHDCWLYYPQPQIRASLWSTPPWGGEVKSNTPWSIIHKYLS